MENLGHLGFTEEQGDLLEVAGAFCRDKSPVEKVRLLMNNDLGHDPGVWEEMAALGWLGIAIPEAHGGAGLGLAEVVPVTEHIGRALLQSPFLSTTLAAQAILAGGTPAQQSMLLPRLATGTPATLALVDQSGDWTPDAVTATATLNGDTVALSGTKLFVTDARVAEHIIASVLCDGAPGLVLIDKADLSETSLRREIIVDETKRSYELTLDGITVPATNFLDPDKATATLAHIHLAANLLGAAEMIGGTKACIDYTVEYLKTRKQFGKLIGSYQALKHPVVDAYVLYEQARSHLYSAANSFTEQGTGEIATRMAKATADQALSFAADRAIQFHGGFGFTYDCDAQLYRRRAIWHASQFGDAAYHKKKLAELLL